MEAKRLGYSTKNIPLSNKDVYLKELIGNTEHFLHRNYHNINDDMNNTIMNSRKAFLQHFDVTEGSFDGAEICELVGLYLLNQLKDIHKWILWWLQRWRSCSCDQIFWPSNGQIKKKYYCLFETTRFSEHYWNKFS